VTISSVRILHANRTRRAFLERVINPLLSANREEPYTLEDALKEVEEATNKLNRFGRIARDKMSRMFLTPHRYLQVANLSLPRPPEPDRPVIITIRCRRIHHSVRARQLHYQDGNRGWRIGSRRLRTRRATEFTWWGRDTQRPRIVRNPHAICLLPRLRQPYSQQSGPQIPGQWLRKLDTEELGKPRGGLEGREFEAPVEVKDRPPT
jgi:hypothetical protein